MAHPVELIVSIIIFLDQNECAAEKGGCEQICENSEGSFYCDCEEGYILSADLLSCKDVDECSDNNGGCQQVSCWIIF